MKGRSTSALLGFSVLLSSASLILHLPAIASAFVPPVGRAIAISGEVRVRRENWETFQTIAPGMLLYESDLIETAFGASLVALCHQNWSVTDTLSNIASAKDLGCAQTSCPPGTIPSEDGCIPEEPKVSWKN